MLFRSFGLPLPQGATAREILALYKWWTEVYPNRPDPHDAGGWSAYCDMRRNKGFHLLDMESEDAEDAAICKTALDKTHEIEDAYRKEDEEMMIRLIKIREALWT